MMDEKMRATYEAWWEKQRNDASTPTDHDIIEWTLDYLRSQQEPEVWSSKSWIKEATDGKSGYIVGEARAGFTVPLFAHPIPSAPAVPDGLTPRHWRLIDFALWRLINDAYSQANFAAQAKDRLQWQPEHVGKFLQDAEDAGAARKIVMKAIADNGWTAAPSPTEKKEG